MIDPTLESLTSDVDGISGPPLVGGRARGRPAPTPTPGRGAGPSCVRPAAWLRLAAAAPPPWVAWRCAAPAAVILLRAPGRRARAPSADCAPGNGSRWRSAPGH